MISLHNRRVLYQAVTSCLRCALLPLETYLTPGKGMVPTPSAEYLFIFNQQQAFLTSIIEPPRRDNSFVFEFWLSHSHFWLRSSSCDFRYDLNMSTVQDLCLNW